MNENKLVLRINELFHDLEQTDYDKKHKDIFVGEVGRWKNASAFLLENNRNPVTILDIGSGTGFVPMQICGKMSERDTFICSDISEKMLSVCKKKIAEHNFNCNFSFVKSDGFSLNLQDGSVNVITINSVLHHIPDFNTFFKEISRILKVNGLLIIGHEPNSLFYRDKFLWYNYRFFFFMMNPAQIILAITKKIGLFEIASHIFHKVHRDKSDNQKIISRINEQLINERLIQKPLSYGRIMELIDVQSPTAGKIRKDKKGIDISSILANHLSNFKIEKIETYNHLPRLNTNGFFMKKYSELLSNTFPQKGATFFVIFKKYEQ